MTTLPPDAILFEDHHLIAVNKPAPLLTQAPPGVPSLEALVKAYIKEQYRKPAGVYLAVPHRLDRPVTGAIVFARNSKAARRVHDQFHDRSVGKSYLAAVAGTVTPPAGSWTDQLRKVPGESRAEIVAEDSPGAKLAVLDYRVLGQFPGGTLLELTPRTGRMHQLRLQSAARGHPILGDVQYGSTRTFGPDAELPRDRLIALHALRLELNHPFRSERLTIRAEPPAELWGPLGWPSADLRFTEPRQVVEIRQLEE